jgi:preprotein translocase subunit SecG
MCHFDILHLEPVGLIFRHTFHGWHMAEKTASEPLSMTAVILGVVFLLILVLIGAVLFFAYPQNGYFDGMLYTGILALVFGVALYLSSALLRGTFLRLASTGAYWFGVVLLLGADLATPDTAFGGTSTSDSFGPGLSRIPLLIVILIIIGIGLGVSLWTTSNKKAVDVREQKREEWRRSTGVIAPGQEQQPPKQQ